MPIVLSFFALVRIRVQSWPGRAMSRSLSLLFFKASRLLTINHAFIASFVLTARQMFSLRFARDAFGLCSLSLSTRQSIETGAKEEGFFEGRNLISNNSKIKSSLYLPPFSFSAH